MSEAPGPSHFRAAAEFVLMLRQKGVADPALLRAMEQVPRVPFLDARHFALADDDLMLPIDCGQSILKPSTTAMMIEALRVAPRHRVLLVGCGSGYAAAILGRLAASVVAVERWRRLADAAHGRLRQLGYDMIEVAFGDGLDGYSPRAPYDRVLMTCAVAIPPQEILAQISPDGVLVAPLSDGAGEATLTRFSGGEATAFGRALIQPARSGVASRL